MSGLNDREVLELDLKKNEYKSIECKQYDDLILHFILSNYGIPIDLTGYTIQANISRPNNTFSIQTRKITTNSNGEVTLVLEKGTTNIDGDTKLELLLINNQKKESRTFDVILDVKKSASNNLQTLKPIMIDIVQEFQDKINECNDEIVILNTTINNSNTARSNLITTINDSNTARSNLGSTINDSNTARSNLGDTINNANNKITEIQNKGSEIITSMDNRNLTSQQLKEDIINQNEVFETKIIKMNELNEKSSELLPIPYEMSHALMNIMGMAIFTERHIGVQYTGAYKNMEIFSLVNSDEMIITDVEYDNTNHRINIGDGYIDGVAYCYE